MTQTPPVGDGAPNESPEARPGASAEGWIRRRPPLSFSSQVKILAQTNDVIGTRPIPEARNEIVKLLLRHTKL